MFKTGWLLSYTSILFLLCVAGDRMSQEPQHAELLGPDRDSQMLLPDKPFLKRVDLVAGLGGNLTDPYASSLNA